MTRWGILATGGIASRFAEDLRLLPDAELVAVGSRTPEGAQAFADRHGIARAHGSWAELAADTRRRRRLRGHAARRPPRGGDDLPARPARRCCWRSRSRSTGRRRRAGRHGPRRADVFLMEAMWMRCNPAAPARRRAGRRRRDRRGDRACRPTSAWPGRSRRSTGCATRRSAAARCSTSASTRSALPTCCSARRDHVRAWAHAQPGGRRREHRHPPRLRHRRGRHAALRHGRRDAGWPPRSPAPTGRIELPAPFFRPPYVHPAPRRRRSRRWSTCRSARQRLPATRRPRCSAACAPG